MDLLLRLRHRLTTRLGVLFAILFFSATAVEVAPHAIDVMQDMGWLAPDAAEAPAEAAALPQPDETLVRSSAIEPVTPVDDEASDRLVQFAASQPGGVEAPAVYISAMSAPDENDAVALLEGVISLGGEPASMPSPLSRSGMVGSNSSGWSAPTSGNPGTTATTTEETFAEGLPLTATGQPVAPATNDTPASPSTQPGPSGPSRELFFVLTENPTAGGISESASPASVVEPSPESSSFPAVSLALVPQPEFGTDTSASPGISLVQNPEPATLLMLGSGLLFVARYGRRKVAR